MRMILTDARHAVVVVLTTAALVAACGDATDDAASDVSAQPVIATTSIWADITSEVGCGVAVPALIPAGADPHTFESSLRDRELIEGSSTIISNGLGLEATLDDLLDTARDAGVDVVEMTDDIDVLTPDDDPDDDDHADGDPDEDGDRDDEHDHDSEGDPHVWQDPVRVAGALDTIASALAAHDVETCTDAYRAALIDLDTENVEALSVVPEHARVLVTSHDSLAYFADRYGFEVVGTVIPSTSTIAETNAADLAELVEAIEEHDVPAIFTEELESTADADALAERLGVEVVPLVTDSLTDDPDADTYIEMMRRNVTAIAGALTP